MIATTGRQLEHWHTGSMTRRAKVLDAVEPEANCSMNPRTLKLMGIEPGEMVRLTTRRGSIEIMVRADRAIAEDMVFIPFAYVEAAANILTNSAIDPYGKIPEFKFSAIRVEKIEDAIGRLHPYEVPEILAVPILSGSQSYLAWLEGELTRPG